MNPNQEQNQTKNENERKGGMPTISAGEGSSGGHVIPPLSQSCRDVSPAEGRDDSRVVKGPITGNGGLELFSPRQTTGESLFRKPRMAEDKLYRSWRATKSTAAAKALMGIKTNDGETMVKPSELTRKELVEQVSKGMDHIRKVANYKKGVKETTKKALREIAAMAEAAIKEISDRPQSEEVNRLQTANDNLRREVELLRVELAAVKQQVASIGRREAEEGDTSSKPQESSSEDECNEPPSSKTKSLPPAAALTGLPRPEPVRRASALAKAPLDSLGVSNEKDELIRAVLVQVGQMLSARFDALEDRLLPEKPLRPPLGVRPPRNGGSKVMAPNNGGKKGPAPSSSSVAERDGGERNASVAYLVPSVSKTWTEVVGRKAKAKEKKKAKQDATLAKNKSGLEGSPKRAERPQHRKNEKKVKIKVPKRAAVVLSAVDSEKTTIAVALSKIRDKINLRALGIASLRPKKAQTGAIIYEVPGERSQELADSLAAKLREELNGEEVKVARPVKTAKLRVSGLDDLTDTREVSEAMAAVGGCKAWEVTVGSIRRSRVGLGSVWVRCPATADRKLSEAGRVQVGWVMARVEALRPRPMQCYRCLRTGHTIGACDSPVDRGSRCYRCGCEGHPASLCEGELNCPLCADLDRPAGHRFGGPACTPAPPPEKDGRRGNSGTAAKPRNATMAKAPNAGGNTEVKAAPAASSQQLGGGGGSLEEAMDTAL
ncbi:uncharacterized protein LOC105207875 [Solenopsis invicta]|uniref:uncharacterized protein LOC105207875 n=1 Tax=Solenopsis invicta TaxID=13686 RepID=UPI00193E04B6|nr:uncharacterized protein LOC105207875 [Solenopsis invicta]